MRISLSLLLLVSSLPLLGDGTLTVNGTTVKLNHAYATTKKNSFDKKKTDVLVVFADRELPADALDDDFKLMDAQDKTHFNGLTAQIDPDKQVTSSQIYSSSLKKMHSFSSTGSQKLELTTMTPTRIAGKLYLPKPDDFFENTYQYSVTFDVPITSPPPPPGPAVLKGKPLPANGGDVRKAYDAYRKVLFAGNMPALKKAVSSERAAMMDDPDFKKMFPLVQAMAPKTYKYVNGAVDGDTATMNVTADNGNEHSTGTITMTREGGMWKVQREEWTSKSE